MTSYADAVREAYIPQEKLMLRVNKLHDLF